MKCPDCGNTNVESKGERIDGEAYECTKCDETFVYTNGK